MYPASLQGTLGASVHTTKAHIKHGSHQYGTNSSDKELRMGHQDKPFRAPLKGSCTKAQGASFREERKGEPTGRKGPKKKGQGGRLWETSTRPWGLPGGAMDRRKESLYHQSVLALKVGMAVLGRDASCASRLPTEKTRQGHLPCMCKILI